MSSSSLLVTLLFFTTVVTVLADSQASAPSPSRGKAPSPAKVAPSSSAPSASAPSASAPSASAPSVGNAAPSGAPQKLEKYTAAEVDKHTTNADLWMILDDFVYDLTDFRTHPGGRDILIRYAGKDNTRVFMSIHRPWVLKTTARKFRIGLLVNEDGSKPSHEESPAPSVAAAPPTTGHPDGYFPPAASLAPAAVGGIAAPGSAPTSPPVAFTHLDL